MPTPRWLLAALLLAASLSAQTRIRLDTQAVGNLPVANLGGGVSASSTTFWRGDGVWAPFAFPWNTNGDLLFYFGGAATRLIAGLGSQYLHGGTVPGFGAIDLSLSVTGNLPVTNLNGGTGANSTTCWHGDGTWGACGSGSGLPGALIPVTFSATNPTYTCTSNTVNVFQMTLVNNITASPNALAGCANGSVVSFMYKQSVGGGLTVVMPTGFGAFRQISGYPLSTTTETFVWDNTNSVATLLGAPVVDIGPSTVPETATAGYTPVAGNSIPYIGTDHLAHTLDSNSNVYPNAHSFALNLKCQDTSASSTTAYVCATTPSFTPAKGDSITFCPIAANSGAATLAFNGIAAAPIKLQQGQAALVANDLRASPACVELTYDGAANWNMQGQGGNAAAGGGTVTDTLRFPAGRDPTGNVSIVGCDVSAFSNATSVGGQGTLSAPDSVSSIVCRLHLPLNWTGGVTLKINQNQNQGGNSGKFVGWKVYTACYGSGDSVVPSYNAAQASTAQAMPATGITLYTDFASLTTTGCAADKEFVLKIERDSTIANDYPNVLNYMGHSLTVSHN